MEKIISKNEVPCIQIVEKILKEEAEGVYIAEEASPEFDIRGYKIRLVNERTGKETIVKLPGPLLSDIRDFTRSYESRYWKELENRVRRLLQEGIRKILPRKGKIGFLSGS